MVATRTTDWGVIGQRGQAKTSFPSLSRSARDYLHLALVGRESRYGSRLRQATGPIARSCCRSAFGRRGTPSRDCRWGRDEVRTTQDQPRPGRSLASPVTVMATAIAKLVAAEPRPRGAPPPAVADRSRSRRLRRCSRRWPAELANVLSSRFSSVSRRGRRAASVVESLGRGRAPLPMVMRYRSRRWLHCIRSPRTTAGRSALFRVSGAIAGAPGAWDPLGRGARYGSCRIWGRLRREYEADVLPQRDRVARSRALATAIANPTHARGGGRPRSSRLCGGWHVVRSFPPAELFDAVPVNEALLGPSVR